MIRDNNTPALLKDHHVEYCLGELLHPQTYMKYLKECDIVIHAAAIASFGLKDSKQYYKVNAGGTKLLCEAAAKNGIKRFIHASTRGVLSVAKIPEKSDEQVGYKKLAEMDDYVRSKFEGEKEVLHIASQGDMECIVLSPTALVGSCDDKPTPIGRIILTFLEGKTRAYMRGGINLIDVEDAAKAFVTAVEKGKSGQVYIIGNKNIQLYDMFKVLGSISGVSLPKIKIPFWFAYIAAMVLEKISLIMGRQPLATAQKVLSLSKNYSYCTSQKAVEELGLNQFPIQNALEKSVNWYYGNTFKRRSSTKF